MERYPVRREEAAKSCVDRALSRNRVVFLAKREVLLCFLANDSDFGLPIGDKDLDGSVGETD